MFKKGVAFLLSGVVMLGFCGCGEQSTNGGVEVSDGVVDVWAKQQIVEDVLGLKFSVPAEWVVEGVRSASQASFFMSLGDYNDTKARSGFSMTSSWAEGISVKDFADTMYEGLTQSSSVASVTRESFKVNGIAVEQVGVVSNGSFGGYEYFKHGNVIVEFLYLTADNRLLGEYEDAVSRIISSIVWVDVKESDFPVVDVSDSGAESSVGSKGSSEGGTSSSVKSTSKSVLDSSNGVIDTSESVSTDGSDEEVGGTDGN